MRSHLVNDIPQDYYFTKNVYLDKQFVLAAPEMPFTKALMNTLANWDFKEVWSEGEPQPEYSALDLKKCGTSETIATMDGDEIKEAEQFYQQFFTYVKSVYENLVVDNALDPKQIEEKVMEALAFINKKQRMLLQIKRVPEKENDPNYQVYHAVNTMITAIIMGMYLKMPKFRLIDLGVAAILHEIGMTKIPPNIYQVKRALTVPEKKAIIEHPILGFKMLRDFDLPLEQRLAALEHHERENGSGYPQKLNASNISLNSKIIAIACSYEALIAAKPYKEALNASAGIMELLKNVGGQYDPTCVKALVFSLSMYPIGLYVLLSNDKKGQVINVSPENPKYPFVQVFGEMTPEGKLKQYETSAEGLYIIRALTKEETATLKADKTAMGLP
ncbi:HD-GYP domain-containing protein [Breznakiellaceae bacterium SP9]